jgi:Golgi phosphoprotein 3
MMTVPEQFLLLTLDTNTGEFLKLPDTYSRAAFAGAALMELALAGRIDSDLDRVWVVDPAVTGDAALDPVLSAMSAAGAPANVECFVEKLVPLGSGVREAALNALLDRGVLERSEQRSMFRKPKSAFALQDRSNLEGMKEALREVLLGTAMPEPRDVCIMTLAKTCDLMGRVIPPQDARKALDRLEAFSKTELIGQTVRRYLYLYERDIARS